MRQHSIDLLPESVRLRAEVGMRAGRFIAGTVAALGALVIVATHSLLTLTSAQDQLFDTSSQAEHVFITEAKAAELRRVMKQSQEYSDLYRRLSFPVDVSAVMATVINAMPDSVTLDQLDLDAGAKQMALTSRTKHEDTKTAAPRVLIGEVSGFAANDLQIAQLVSALEQAAPFKDVSLDFSRTRRVNDRDAREFRLSFRIDLDAPYAVTYLDPSQSSGGAVTADGNERRGAGDVQ